MDAGPTGNYFVAAYPPFSVWTQTQVPAALAAIRQSFDSIPAAPLGLYIHIPFCSTRCDYCYYLSYGQSSAQQREDYVNCLLVEWRAYSRSPYFAGRSPQFIYFGGGTPSLLGSKLAQRLLQGIRTVSPWDQVEEVTFECAPLSVDAELAAVLRDAGVTRVSLGVQSWSDEVLFTSRRMHTVDDALAAHDILQRASFPVFNMDLIAGLPGDNEENFLATVEKTIALCPESITIYQLETPYYTALSRKMRAAESTIQLPNSAMKRRWLNMAFDLLEGAEYKIRSAYTAVRDLRRHAFLYQDLQYRGADILGLGASAFSYCNGFHFQNQTSLATYAEAVLRGEHPIERANRLNERQRYVREFVLQLKLGSVNLAALGEKYALEISAELEPALRECASRGWLKWNMKEVRLTRDGLLRADSMLSMFYLPEHRGIAYN